MDEEIFHFDIIKDCRICLQRYPDMHKLFAEANSFGNLLREYGRVEIEVNDGLPTVICEFCIKELMHVHQFITKCQTSDKKLRLSLKSNSDRNSTQNVNELKGNALNIAAGSIKLEVEYSPPHQSSKISEFHFDDTVKEENDHFDVNHTTVPKKPELKTCKIKKNKQKNSAAIHSEILYVSEKKTKEKKTPREKIKKLKSDLGFPKRCTECPLVLKTKSTMFIHMLTHSGENSFQCDYCGKCVGSRGSLQRHIIRFHMEDNVNKYLCTGCNKKFLKESNLIAHNRAPCNETPYACTYCPKKFTTMSQFNRHTGIHTGIKPFQCDQCSKAFKSKFELDRHKVKHSNERTHPCPICGQSYKWKQTLKCHMMLHNNPRSFVCHQCGASFNGEPALIKHMKTMHSNRAGMCSFCNKEFSNLENHMRMHTGETPFQCHICNKKYRMKQCLNNHMRTHSDVSKYKCEYEGCLKAFKLQYMLDFHVNKYHKKEPMYPCKYCTRGFFRVSDVRVHIDSSHSDKEYVSTEELRKSKLH